MSATVFPEVAREAIFSRPPLALQANYEVAKAGRMDTFVQVATPATECNIQSDRPTLLAAIEIEIPEWLAQPLGFRGFDQEAEESLSE